MVFVFQAMAPQVKAPKEVLDRAQKVSLFFNQKTLAALEANKLPPEDLASIAFLLSKPNNELTMKARAVLTPEYQKVFDKIAAHANVKEAVNQTNSLIEQSAATPAMSTTEKALWGVATVGALLAATTAAYAIYRKIGRGVAGKAVAGVEELVGEAGEKAAGLAAKAAEKLQIEAPVITGLKQAITRNKANAAVIEKLGKKLASQGVQIEAGGQTRTIAGMQVEGKEVVILLKTEVGTIDRLIAAGRKIPGMQKLTEAGKEVKKTKEALAEADKALKREMGKGKTGNALKKFQDVVDAAEAAVKAAEQKLEAEGKRAGAGTVKLSEVTNFRQPVRGLAALRSATSGASGSVASGTGRFGEKAGKASGEDAVVAGIMGNVNSQLGISWVKPAGVAVGTAAAAVAGWRMQKKREEGAEASGERALEGRRQGFEIVAGEVERLNKLGPSELFAELQTRGSPNAKADARWISEKLAEHSELTASELERIETEKGLLRTNENYATLLKGYLQSQWK